MFVVVIGVGVVIVVGVVRCSKKGVGEWLDE